MHLNDAYSLTLKKFYWLAQAIQSEIRSFHPDLLIVLARGGFGPLWALQALWKVTEVKHLPPLLITNLGREKLLRYEYHREAIGVNFIPVFEPFDFFGACERGYFLAWLEKQADWRSQLRQQVKTVLGDTCSPARIIVIDDTVNKRYTTLIVLGLLLSEFPEAEIRMMAGDLPDWRQDLAAPWLEKHAVRQPRPSKKELEDSVYNLASGSSDIDPASLRWEPLNASSPAMREYGKYLPVETWLGLSGWMQEQIQTSIHQFVGQQEEPETAQKWNNLVRSCLEPDELIFRQRWLAADLTPEEVSMELDMSYEEAVQLLKNLANDK